MTRTNADDIQDLDIVDLRSAPQYLPRLAEWHQDEWSNLNPGQTLSQRIDKMQAYLDDRPVPTTRVALSKGDLLGSAALIECDMDTHPELRPWLASLYVAPAFRCRGVGRRLVEATVEAAGRAGFPMIYLFTPGQADFYTGLGWQAVAVETYRQHTVTLMSRETCTILTSERTP